MQASAMDLALPDAQLGRDFSSKVWNLLGVLVSYGEDGPSTTFFLLVSFPRFRFRLSSESVGACLSSILGGTSNNFAPLQLDAQIFRFSVSCKRVGFLVLQLDFFACESFKRAFHLCNDLGFQAALSFSKMDSGPSFSWTAVTHKKKKFSSYADAVHSKPVPLSGANSVPLGGNHQHPRVISPSRRRRSVFDRLDFRTENQSLGLSGNSSSSRISVFNRISSPRKSIFERLNFQSRSQGQKFQILNEKSKGPPTSRPNTVTGSQNLCKRCLSPNH